MTSYLSVQHITIGLWLCFVLTLFSCLLLSAFLSEHISEATMPMSVSSSFDSLPSSVLHTWGEKQLDGSAFEICSCLDSLLTWCLASFCTLCTEGSTVFSSAADGDAGFVGKGIQGLKFLWYSVIFGMGSWYEVSVWNTVTDWNNFWKKNI